MGSRRNELNMHLNERLVKIYENRTFVLLISGLILLTLCIILFVQIVTYKLRIRKSSLRICICFIILAVAGIVTGISSLGGFNHE